MKVLVTGGAGFIGSHLVEKLVKKGFELRIIDDFSNGSIENLKDFQDQIEIIKGDILEFDLINSAMKDVDVVFHLAAAISVPRSIKDPRRTSLVNVQGTINVLEAARNNGVKRVIFSSSSSVYGDSPGLPKRETQTPSPKSPYGVSKLTGELYMKLYSDIFDLETISLRYFNVFGPKQNPYSPYSAVIPKFILNALKGKPLQVRGDGTQTRDFTFVMNVVEANIAAMRAPKNVARGEIFNIGCGKSISINELVQCLKEFLDEELRVEHLPAIKGEIIHSVSDITKAQSLLGWRPLIDFASK